MKFNMYKYADILWMDDLDWNDDEALNPESYSPEGSEFATQDDVAQYIPEKYHFRVHPYKYVLQVLVDLKNNFTQYSCVVLDINMRQGFCFQEFDEIKEYKQIYDLLISENVCIRSEHTWDNDGYEQFKANAGYYIYLYLLHKGMPAERIAILTGNKGEGNLTGEWEDNFKQAGLNPPKAFDKDTQKKEFHLWLDEMLTKQQRLRSCMVIMSHYILDSIKDKEHIDDGFAYKMKQNEFNNLITRKMALQFMQDISLRLPTNESDACDFFQPLLWQISQPWEASEPLNFNHYIRNIEDSEPHLQNVKYAFWTTMRTARNWLAHNIVKKFEHLNTVAFIFGISLRGMFNISKELKDNYLNEYIRWEDELLSLICDKNLQSTLNHSDFNNLNSLVIKSCSEYHKRVLDKIKVNAKLRINEHTRNICYLINEIGQKNNNIQCDENDLLRDFLHGINYLDIKEDESNIKTTPKSDSIRYKLEVHMKCQKSYRNFLVYKTNNSNNDQKNININSNREWNYIESIYKIIKDSI